MGWFNGDILVGTPGSKIDVTEDITLTAMARNTKAPTVVVAREDFNTFRWTATDVVPITGYQISKNSAVPSATGTGWTNGNINTGTYDISEEGTYYVYVKNEDGIVGRGMINAYTVSRNQGTGTTLTTKIDSSSGEEFTNTTNVLDGTTIYVAGSLNTGYSSLVLKNKDNVISAGNQTITSNSIFKSSATASTFTITLDKQSGTGGTSTIYETYGSKYSLTSNGQKMTTSENPITIPTKNGYAFLGYYTGLNGAGIQYIDKNGHLTSNASTTNFTSNGTLYARWEEVTLRTSETNMYSTTVNFLYTTLERKMIKSITFANSIAGHTVDGSTCFDVSSVTNSGQVLLWITNTDANGYYDIVIGQNGGVKANPNSSYLFSCIGYNSSITTFTIDFTNFYTSGVKNMRYMFYRCGYYGLQNLNLGNNFDTSSVINMSNMFSCCGYAAMTSLNLGNNFDTSSVEDMGSMFFECGYLRMTSLNLGNKFYTSSVREMYHMFDGCGNTAMTSLDLGDKFDTSNVQNMNSMFSYCGYTAMTSLDLGEKFDTSSVQNMNSMFSNCGYTAMTSLDLGGKFDTSSVTDMGSMFLDCGYTAMTSLDLGDRFNTLNVTNMAGMFSGCGYMAMTNLNLRDKFDTSNVTNMEAMFSDCGCIAMTSLDLGDKFNTSNVTNMYLMFNGCGYIAMTNLDLGDKFNTSNVTNMDAMFLRCGYTAMTSLDLGDKFNTSSVTNMEAMFDGCGYTAMTSLDLGDNFNTSNVTDMIFMFHECGYTVMTSLDLGDKFDTSNVTNMYCMFSGCGSTAMTSLDISAMTFPSTLTSYSDVFKRLWYIRLCCICKVFNRESMD